MRRIKALTIWPAEIFGADKDIGSIAQGKLANLFIATGDPLDLSIADHDGVHQGAPGAGRRSASPVVPEVQGAAVDEDHAVMKS